MMAACCTGKTSTKYTVLMRDKSFILKREMYFFLKWLNNEYLFKNAHVHELMSQNDVELMS